MSDSTASTIAQEPPRSAGSESLIRMERWDWLLAGGFVVAMAVGAIELKTLTGLPAHPLLLHMPVIFVPMLATAAIVFAFQPEWRQRYNLAYGIGALVTLATTGLAVGAGEALKESREGRVPADEAALLDRHADLGSATRIAVIALVVLILIQIAIDRGVFAKLSERFRSPRALPAVALTVLVVVMAAVSGGLVVATGHAGAKVTFGEDSAQGPQPGAQEEDGDGR